MSSIAAQISAAEKITSSALVPWLVRSIAVNRSTRAGAADTAEQLGAPPAIVDAVKAAVAAATTGTAPMLAGSSVATTAFIEGVAPQSLLLRMIVDRAINRAPLNTRLIASTGRASGARITEGKAIPVLPIDFDGMMLDEEKVGGIIAMTEELWNDTSSAGQQFAIGRLREAVATAADRLFFDTLLNPADLGTEVDLLAALGALLESVHTQPGNLYWAFSTDAANAAALTEHPRVDPLGGTVLGRPAVITGGMTGKRIALVDGKGLVAEVTGIDVKASNEAALEMSDNPDHDSDTPAAAELVSLWQNNLLAARAILRMGVQKISVGSAAVVQVA